MLRVQKKFSPAFWRVWQKTLKSVGITTIPENPMQDVEIYTSPLCGFCHAAKRLLTKKGVTFTEVDVLRHPARKSEMMDRAHGRHTVPQIFIGGTHVGGCDELYELERAGKLDPMLAG